jgi:hypothetical protein
LAQHDIVQHESGNEIAPDPPDLEIAVKDAV